MKSFSKHLKKLLSDSNINKLFYMFLVMIFIINTLWIILDNYAPRGNGKEFVMDITNVDKKTALEKINYLLAEHETPRHPRFIEITIIPYYVLFGIHTKNELIVNSFYLLILVLSVYKIGEIIYNKKTGFLAAIIMVSFPVIISLSKMTYREFHLLCFSAFSFWFMLKTKYYTNLRNSALFGLIVGLTLLTRYDAAVYLFPQIAFYTIFALYKSYKYYLRKKKLNNIPLNIVICVVVILVMAGGWYNRNYDFIKNRTLNRFSNTEIEIDKKDFDTLSKENLLYYSSQLINKNIGIVFGTLFLFSLVYIFFRKTIFEEKLLIFTFVFNYLLFTFISIKAYTKMIPSYFVIPILISGAISNFKLKKVLKSVLLVGIVLYCFSIITLPILNFKYDRRFIPHFREIGPPSSEPSRGEKVFFYINDESYGQDNINIILVSNDHTDYWDLMYFNNIYDKNYIILSEFQYKDGYYLKWSSPNYFYSNFDFKDIIKNKKADFLVVFLPTDGSKQDQELLYIRYKPSYHLLEIKELNENYDLIEEMINSERHYEKVLIYKLKNSFN